MRGTLLRILCGCALALVAGPAAAQQPAPGFSTSISFKRERIGENHVVLIGSVELESGDTKVYTDQAEFFTDTHRAIFTGNVVFTQGANRISADRADFDYETKLGTFYHATGIATVQPPRQRVTPGAVAPPPVAGQDTDVYFYGESVEKIGPKKYRIIKGGFTTCVQPTPRWELSSETVTLNVDHYTFLRQSIFKVKGVPMLYVPILYYPTKREQRATGFLIPTYGSSTIRGQAIHNAFFWAIDRSQDATFLYDWFSKTGQGTGGEYRYNYGAGSDGNIRAYMLDSHEATFAQPDGTTSTLPASRTFEVRGGMNQALPGNLRARANVSYFSDITTMQTFNTNIYDASQRQRTLGGNITGTWRSYTLNGTFDRSEYFYGTTSSALTGGTPRIAFAKNERPLLDSPLYFSVGTEYAHLLRESKDESQTPTVEINQGLNRFDFAPQIRYPFKKWQWFTINSTVLWHDTYYTRSLDPNQTDPVTNQSKILDRGVNRQYFDFQAQLVGPVFNRIWDTPGNGYAEKFKHSVEPYLNIERTSAIDNFNQIIQLEGVDSIVGGTTRYTYGVNNRFYAKRREGTLHQARDIVDVELTQSYYTDERASQYDQQYATSFTGAAASHFSPIALSVRAAPTNDLTVSTRAEFDSRYHSLRTISLTAGYAWTGRLQTQFGWSKRAFIPELQGFNDPNFLDHYINGSVNAHAKDNRIGGLYSFNYDVLHSSMLQQRMTGFYNAQCCGLAFEYQTFNFSGISSLSGIVPADHRFFLSFTLAGLGNFSPFSGAMSGVPR